MKVLSVQAIDVRGLPNRLYSFEKGPEEARDLVLIAGGPGTGKTRLLELIVAVREAIAPSDERIEHAPFIRHSNETSKAIVSWLLSAEEQATIGAPTRVVSTEVIFGERSAAEGVDAGMLFLLARYGHDDETPKLEYFSERRRLTLGHRGPSLDEDAQQRLRTTSSPRKFAWLEGFMSSLRETPAQEERFAAGLDGLSMTAGYDLALHALFSRGRALRSLTELSATEGDAVVFAATAALVGLSHSIVLVDRPELHGLDPLRALEGIAALGVDNQLIVATSSPELVRSFDGVVIQLDSDGPFHRGFG